MSENTHSPLPWRCFHCDDLFHDKEDAALHFGSSECSSPACQIKVHEGGLVKAYRQIEDELAKWKIECAEGQLDYYRDNSRRNEAVQSAEDAGYAAGLEAYAATIASQESRIEQMREALELADEFARLGLFNAPEGMLKEVTAKRKAALAAKEGEV